MSAVKVKEKQNQKPITEQNLKKYLCKIEFPKNNYGKGIFCKMPHQNSGEINVLLTNHKFEGIDNSNSKEKIKLYLSNGKQIFINLKNKESNDNNYFRDFYQDEESGITMIEIKEKEIVNFLEIDKDYYLYDNMEVYLINFSSNNKLDLCVGLIPENENNLMNVDDNKIEIWCFNKKESSGGIMIYDEKVIGFHFGNNNKEGKYWNSCIYLFHFIRNYFIKKNWRFIIKHKRKDGKGTTKKNKQNDQNKQCEQDEQKTAQNNEKNIENKTNDPNQSLTCIYSSARISNPAKISNQFNNNQNLYLMNQKMNPQTNQQMNQQMNQPMEHQMNNQMHQQMNQQMNPQMNQPMEHQMNNQMHQHNLFPQNNLNQLNPMTDPIIRKKNFPNTFPQNVNNLNPRSMGKQNIKINYNNNPIPSCNSMKINDPSYMKMMMNNNMNYGQFNNVQDFNLRMNYNQNINYMNPSQNNFQNMNNWSNNQVPNNNNFMHK